MRELIAERKGSRANNSQFSQGSARKLFEQLTGEWANVLQPIRSRAKQYDRDFEFPQVLFYSELAVNRDEDFKFLLGQREQISIFDSGPTFPRYSSNFMADKIASKSTVDAFVEQDLHFATAASMRSLASSRKATT